MDKAWYAAGTDTPCTHCGDCCRQLPCSLGELDDNGQCVELREDGCALAERDPLMAEALLIGYGCGATFIPKVVKLLARQKNE